MTDTDDEFLSLTQLMAAIQRELRRGHDDTKNWVEMPADLRTIIERHEVRNHWPGVGSLTSLLVAKGLITQDEMEEVQRRDALAMLRQLRSNNKFAEAVIAKERRKILDKPKGT